MIMETYFYCITSYKDGVQRYNSGSVSAGGKNKAMLATEVLDHLCKELGIDRTQAVLTALNKL